MRMRLRTASLKALSRRINHAFNQTSTSIDGYLLHSYIGSGVCPIDATYIATDTPGNNQWQHAAGLDEER